MSKITLSFPLFFRGPAVGKASCPLGPGISWKGIQGFSLVELMVVVMILGTVALALQQVMTQFLITQTGSREKVQLLNQARFTLDRITAMVQETAYLEYPLLGGTDEQLRFGEHSMDMFNNTSHAFVAAGDGKLDADNDGNGLVNDGPGGSDPVDLVTLKLDKTQLVEILPDYSTASLTDFLPQRVLAENVTEFACTLVTQNLVEILLVLENKNISARLKTRAIAGRVLL
ncbi:MAG: type II secretion system protein [Desulfobacula sp.]|jgi:prepilin-type N-terminal cleavage/methylation domain-containing protein|nr:type II secretion system protein [Desulfobacula sp.]